ncbi:HD-GYP domain-containing protein [Paenibacillus tarimensis]
MPTVQLSQLKIGDKLIQDVQTPLGGVLLQKGKIIMPREIDILQAFLIPTVAIAARSGIGHEQVETEATDEPVAEHTPTASFQKEYDRLFALIKNVFSQYNAALSIPILEIRKQLESLLNHINEYNVLKFSPQIYNNEDYMFHNSVLTALSSYQLAQWSGMPHKDWIPSALAGLFHDIGNIKVDKTILNKPEALTSSEAEEMKKHTVHGYQMLKPIPAINEGVKLTALQHHEKVDGSGYPLGLKGEKIHPYARIVAVADIYHAMTLKRAYRMPASPYLVLEQLQQESFGQLDPVLVQLFIGKATQFHNGTVVRLSDNRIGEIVFSDRNHLTRPWVSIDGSIINLTIERHLHIREIITK